ncbi:19695_t:CDS:1, partial [Gigaspora margarita]
MNQPANQTISAQRQNNNQLQGSYNFGGPQNTGALSQRTVDVQRYTDLVGGTDLFTRTQDIESQSTQGAQFST